MLLLTSASLFLTAACGSTVQSAGSATGADALDPAAAGLESGVGSGTTTAGDGLALTGPAQGAVGAGTGATGGTGASGSVGTNGSGPLTASVDGGAGVGQSAAAAAARPVPRGKDLQVGVIYTTGTEAADAALGQSGLDRGDARAETEALLEDLNKRGGISGRKVVPVYYAWDSNSSESAETQYSAACTRFTQDARVFAVFGGGSGNYQACLEKAGVVVIEAGALTQASTSTFARLRHFVQTAAPSLDRLAGVQAEELLAMGFFGSKAKVGVLTADTPEFATAVRQQLIPPLRRAPGITLDDANVVFVRSTSNQDALADISSAVLRMKADGVTHMIIFDSAGGLTLYFTRAAQSQDYHPVYGINTQSAVQVLAETGLGDKEQFRGAMGVGWAPIYDQPYSVYGKTKGNALRDRCLAFMRSRGLGPSDANSESINLGNCSTVWFLELVASRAQGPLTADSVMAAVDRLGSSWPDPSTFATSFSTSKRDGAAALRRMAFDSSCACLRYTSPPKRFG